MIAIGSLLHNTVMQKTYNLILTTMISTCFMRRGLSFLMKFGLA